MNCQVRCHPKLEARLAHRLGSGCVVKVRSRERIPIGSGLGVRAYFTPGHEDDHVAYYFPPDKAVFSGDCILGSSSSSVRNLKQYMASLELLAGLRPDLLCPGHGQVLRNATGRVQWYIKHRQEREEQVLAAMEGGAVTVDEISRAVYPRNLRKNLRGAAANNVRTHLQKLKEEGRVAESATNYSLSHG